MRLEQLVIGVAAAVALAACGGGGGGAAGGAGVAALGTASSAGASTATAGSSPPVATGGDTPTPPPTGKLLDSPVVLATMTTTQIDAVTASRGIQALTGRARCDVELVSLNYSASGPKAESSNASGVLLMPVGSCQTSAAPLVAHARGTEVLKSKTMADAQNPETVFLAAMYASQGYAVVATDYLGFAKSAFPYHPYLHADSAARAVLDSIRAAREAVGVVGGKLSGKVMLTGYSQGGHSSMAAQRLAERDYASEFNIVGGAHLAGPYNLSGAFQHPIAINDYQFWVPFVITSYQKIYGDVYANVNDVFKAPYAAGIENLLPNATLDYGALMSTGALPGGHGETPSQVRDALIQASYQTDVQTNANNALYKRAKENDLFGWSPKAQTLLCGGAEDRTVPTSIHMMRMKADFDARGVTTVSTVDVDAQIQATFGPGGSAPTDPMSAAYATYYSAYHGTYEPPFCHARARSLFDTMR